jgi:hypothetical protein
VKLHSTLAAKMDDGTYYLTVFGQKKGTRRTTAEVFKVCSFAPLTLDAADSLTLAFDKAIRCECDVLLG